MGNQLELERIDDLLEANGSLGHSPSATAYLLCQCQGHPATRQYLAEVIGLGHDAAMPAHPVEIFDTSWVLYNLELANYYASLNGPLTTRLVDLSRAWVADRGVGFSREYSVPDLDDTAMVFKLLGRAGYSLDIAVFRQYERENHFACYSFERNPSVGVHVHLLEALSQYPQNSETRQMRQKILRFLHRSRLQGAYWFDKWLISPYYITSHAIIATLSCDPELARDAIDWMLSTQQADGSWGFYQPTAEETAYCLQALAIYHREAQRLDRAVLDRAAQFLAERYTQPDHPAMWIEKALYTPIHIVRSALISALSLYAALH